MGCECYFYLLRSCQAPHKRTSVSTQTATRFFLSSPCRSHLFPGQSGCSHISALLSTDVQCPSFVTCHTCHLPLCHCSSSLSYIREQATASLEAVQTQSGCRQAPCTRAWHWAATAAHVTSGPSDPSNGADSISI